MKYFVYCRKSQEAEDRQVMSLASQADEIDRLIAADHTIEIVDRYDEAFSAKQPGRPLFDAMLKRIEDGEADGIIAWHPDRLARNSMDGGRVIYLLDTGAMKDLRFCSYAFENSSQGKFMLNIIFGYSKYYVDSLSENVKRGFRTKLRNGWRPNLAPIGYRNCRETGTIVPDGEHFEAVKAMFELLLTGSYTVSHIHRIVCDRWGYVTPVWKSRGGKQLGRSALYRILSNPFYAGYFRWNGELHIGSHQPLISKAAFEKAQTLLHRPNQPRPKKLAFVYRGIFKCGACGLGVTAERKRKPGGRTYVYYHCTRVHRTPRCRQPSIEEKELERQIVAFLDRIRLPKSIDDWLNRATNATEAEIAQARSQAMKPLANRVKGLKRQIETLTDLRVREIVDDAEFLTKREHLQLQLGKAEEELQRAQTETVTFEPVRILEMLCNGAKNWFSAGDEETKRTILKILCSNPVLKDGKALLEAKKPFVELHHLAQFPHLRGDKDLVRRVTPHPNMPFQDPQGTNEVLRAWTSDHAVLVTTKEAQRLFDKIAAQEIHRSN
ncbi:MAG: recombinase family protein [Rhodobiaceae bacterium]|nr:recombinase family protein [Rhodobiaceae bacterium]MCC0055013.1 recombinase family protein [Rhodobiaceae bacterium]